MRSRTLAWCGVTLAAALILSSPAGMAQSGDDSTDRSGDRPIVHLLNRIGYGPRPGDIDTVRAIGIDKYVDLQLHPERVDDRAMDAWLSSLTTVHMSSREIADTFERPQLEARRQAQLQTGQNPPPAPPPAPGMQPAQTPMLELQEQKLLRAIYSERQLQEVLADFWFNHFNVDARKGRVRFLLTEYERESIRPHVLGTFRELLGATAKSPAMLFYLDNVQSVDPNAAMNRGRGARPRVQAGRGRFGVLLPVPQQPPPPQNVPRGLNENYARELMELHTLGVDGGYTQKDVTEVARAFTGWTIDNPRLGGGFSFNARLHDDRDKTVLGHRLKSGGIRDGEDVLDILAAHPSTARFISTKLARRFVSDTPPPALVDRMAKTFTETRGDLREVMRTLLTSREFQSPDAYRSKIKTPLEFIVSAVRATGLELVNARPLINALQQLGMPLYQCQPPTGYKDTAETWTNTGALVTRMNFATTIATNRQLGMTPRQLQSLGSGEMLLGAVLHDDASAATRTTVAKAPTAPQMLALALGSPEFQRR